MSSFVLEILKLHFEVLVYFMIRSSSYLRYVFSGQVNANGSINRIQFVAWATEAFKEDILVSSAVVAAMESCDELPIEDDPEVSPLY